MTKPAAPHDDHEADVYDTVLAALDQYNTLFGEALTGSQLEAAWRSLKSTPEPVKQHMGLRLQYLQAKAMAELGADVAELREMLARSVAHTRTLSRFAKATQEPLLDAADDLRAVRTVWDDEAPAEPPEPALEEPAEPADDGNVSTPGEEA